MILIPSNKPHYTMMSLIQTIIQARTKLTQIWRNQSREQRKWCGILAAWTFLFIQISLVSWGFMPPPVLSQTCYKNFRNPSTFPSNVCCEMRNYTKQDFFSCINNAIQVYARRQKYSKDGFDFSEDSNSFKNHGIIKSFENMRMEANNISLQDTISTSKSKFLWVMIGDSRVRQVFSALVSKLSGPRLEYKKPSTLGKWRSTHELAEILRIGKLHEDIEIKHSDYPLQMKFYWDPKLYRLPAITKYWMSNEYEKPSVLLLGSGLHWMRHSLHTYRTSGQQIAAQKFKAHIENLSLELKSIASTTDTIIQLQDPIQESKVFPKYEGIFSNENIDLYNNIIMSTFSKSNVILWDSNIPFAKHYLAQCQKNPIKSFDKLWNCENPFHPGFIIVEKYLNMLLNGVCNKYLDLSELYC